MKPVNLLVVFVVIGSLAGLGLAPAPAPAAAPVTVTATILPKTLVTARGSTSGTVTALAFRDQSGAQNNSAKYVEFATPGVTYSGYRKFFLSPHINPNKINGMNVKVNYRGPLRAAQEWSWQVYSWDYGKWIKIGTNASAVSGSWALFTFNIPAPFARFFGPKGEFWLRLQSNNASGNAWLDYEALMVTYEAPLPSGVYWKPGLVNSWQIQYSGTINTNLNVKVYNLDGFDTPKSTVDALHARGIKVMCYFSAGSWEAWRPDKNQFPSYVLGKTLAGWPDERWLDIRRLDILAPIMMARMDMCKSKGFDGIDPDNVDGYANDTGLPLTAQDQLNYNLFLAAIAHQKGLAAGLKNDVDQIATLVLYFDWELNEECFTYDECDKLLPFIHAGKPVFNIEYELAAAAFCPQANAMNFNSLKKNLSLDAWRVPCR